MLRLLPTAVALTLLATTLVFTGCKSTEGHERAETTASKLDLFETALGTLRTQVSAAASSLATVVEKRDEDPKPAFAKFSSDADALRDRLAAATSGLGAVQAESKSYFESWQKQSAAITDADLRKRSEERQAKLSGAVAAIAEAMQPAASELAAYVSMLGDLKTYLSNDLNPDGIVAIRDKSRSATKSAKSIHDQLGEVLEKVQEAAPLFAAAKPPPPEASAKP